MKPSYFLLLFLWVASSCTTPSSNQPVSPVKETPPQAPEAIVFAIDVSASMLARDFDPNRLEVVKEMLRSMIKNKEAHQQISIVLFAGKAFILCPLTSDTDQLLKQVALIETGKISPGTAIGTAILSGLYELKQSSAATKHLVILTDGMNNSDYFSPKLVMQMAQQEQVLVHSFGVGCEGTALVPVAKRPDGSLIFDHLPVEIDEELLKEVGEQTNGVYTRVTCNADLEAIKSLKVLLHNSDTSTAPPTSLLRATLIDSIYQHIQLDNAETLEQYING